MDILQAKKLFTPPDKLDSTKQHLINIANKSFETLATDLVDLCPNSVHLDETIHTLNKARLLFVHGIEHSKPEAKPEKKVTKKQQPEKEEEFL